MANGNTKTSVQGQHGTMPTGKGFGNSFGSLDPSSTNDGAGPTGQMTAGNGIPATNFNVAVNHIAKVELGLKVHNRGDDIIPASWDDDGTANYIVPSGHSGTGSGERALWNFAFAVNTGIGGSGQTLDAFNFRLVIESGDGERAVFDMQHDGPGITPWLNFATGGMIVDDDGYGPGNGSGGSPQISQGSLNLGVGFLRSIFGDDYDDAGESYHIELLAFGDLRLVGRIAMDIDLV